MVSRSFRIASQLIILLLLLIILAYQIQSKPVQLDWTQPVVLHIYPVNADQQADTAAYLAQLRVSDFRDIEQFFAREARNYRLNLEYPVRVELHPPLDQVPPRAPEEASIVQALWWGLRMRLWVAFNDPDTAVSDTTNPDNTVRDNTIRDNTVRDNTIRDNTVRDNTIRVFMNFYAPHSGGGNQHSLGLQKGRIGLVNGYASKVLQGVNNFVAVHEALHTLGAADRYDPATAEPLWPHGYADPVQTPLYPQTRAEIMGGRIQLVPGWAVLPPGLEQARIGPATAIEIGWLDAVVRSESQH